MAKADLVKRKVENFFSEPEKLRISGMLRGKKSLGLLRALSAEKKALDFQAPPIYYVCITRKKCRHQPSMEKRNKESR